MGIYGLRRQIYFASDTVLGVFAHVSLALDVIVVGFIENLRLDLMGYLFGGILAVRHIDLICIYVGGGSHSAF